MGTKDHIEEPSVVVLRQATDWPHWATSLQSLLKRKKCIKPIKPFPSAPSDSDEAKEHAKQRSKDTAEEMIDMAHGYVTASVDRDLWCVFGEEEDPYAVIQMLYDYFFQRTGSNLVTLTTQFNELTLSPGEKIMHFIKRIDEAAKNLKALGGPLSDHQLVARLRAGTKHIPDWKLYFTVEDMNESQGIKRDYKNICKAACLHETSITADTKDPAMYGSSNTPADQKAKTKCGRCGKPNHTAEKCYAIIEPPAGSRAAAKLKQQQQQRKPRTPCDCGEWHWRSDCPKKAGKTTKDAAYLSVQPKTFCLDSGATKHIVNDKSLIVDFRETTSADPYTVLGVSGNEIKVPAIGKLKDYPGLTYYVADSPENLLSLSTLEDHGWDYKKTEDGQRLLITPGGRQLTINRRDGMYRIDCCFMAVPTDSHAADMLHWHETLGHIQTVTRLRATAAKLNIDTSGWPKEIPHCNACIEGKLTRAPISRKPTDYANRDSQYKPGARLHIDLMGPLENGDYALDAVDDNTRYHMAAFMGRKSDAAATTAKLIDSGYTKRQVDPEQFHSDRGGELTSSSFQDMCRERGIHQTLTASGTPEHNGIVERVHGVTASMTRTMLSAAGLDPKKFGRQAYQHAVYLRNISTTRSLPDGTTPYELWHGTPARTDNLLPFGAKVFYHTKENSKFGKRAAPGLYMGPALNTTGGAIRVHSIETGHEIVTRSYKLNQPGTQVAAPVRQQPPDHIFLDDSDSEDEGIDAGQPTPMLTPAPESAPTPKPSVPSKPLHDIHAAGFDCLPEGKTRSQARAAQGEQPAADRAMIVTSQTAPVEVLLASDNLPSTYKRAMQLPDAKEWDAAFKKELQGLMDKKVFSVAPWQPGTPLNMRYVLKHKTDKDNKIIGRKVRLVACGNTQVYGVNFFDTSAPVVSKEAVRITLALAAHKGYHMVQFDFDQAYINAKLDTSIYARLPDGFADILGDSLTAEEIQLIKSGRAQLQINRALYGLKQAGLLWFKNICALLISMGFKQCESDPCVFTGNGAIIILYVDDGIIYAESKVLADSIYKQIAAHYATKYIGEPQFFLGNTIERRADGSIFMHQHGYSKLMGANYSAGAHAKSTPIPPGAAPNSDSPPADKQKYAEMIGTALFAAVSTRPDLAYAVSVESRFMQAPTHAHMTLVRNTIAYAASTANSGLLFKPAPGINLEVYCDASFAPEEHDRKSRSGWLVLINGTPVSWKSGLQPIIAHSTAEAEYIAMSDAIREATFVRRLLQELGFDSGPITVHEDNTTTKIMAEEIATKRSKHIEVRYHHVRHLVSDGTIKIKYCPTADQLADALTKALPKDTFNNLRARFMAKGE